MFGGGGQNLRIRWLCGVHGSGCYSLAEHRLNFNPGRQVEEIFGLNGFGLNFSPG
jgi:hypothetical protein